MNTHFSDSAHVSEECGPDARRVVELAERRRWTGGISCTECSVILAQERVILCRNHMEATSNPV